MTTNLLFLLHSHINTMFCSVLFIIRKQIQMNSLEVTTNKQES